MIRIPYIYQTDEVTAVETASKHDAASKTETML